VRNYEQREVKAKERKKVAGWEEEIIDKHGRMMREG
jgi:hypothetical protein